MSHTIDAALFCGMVLSASNTLTRQKDAVDALNVFPVPDGDTGTNMSLTFSNAAKELGGREFETIGEVAGVVATATLRGARGNSGVILSQIFRGFSKSLAGLTVADCAALAKAFSEASDTAYRAVMKPTEGTILTVIKSCSEAAAKKADSKNPEKLLEYVCKKGNESLERTPELLPALKQAGVVDSGGKGLMIILEAMLAYLKTGEMAPGGEDSAPAIAPKAMELPLEDIKFAYCTEFIINKKNCGVQSTTQFRNKISKKGDSVVVIEDIDIIKVHIHTNNPGYVVERALELGELVNIKIENMRQQHQSILNLQTQPTPKAPEKDYAILAVASGGGLVKIFQDLGADAVMEGGQTMNPSTEDILKETDGLNAKCIFILPNNKNIILAAEQAAELTDKKVIVIQTKSIPQGLSALLAFQAARPVDENAEAMLAAAGGAKTGEVTYAVRDTVVDGKEIQEGDYLGLAEHKIVMTGADRAGVARALLASMLDDDSEVATILWGEGADEEEANQLAADLEEEFPDCEFSVMEGGQPVYGYILSVE